MNQVVEDPGRLPGRGSLVMLPALVIAGLVATGIFDLVAIVYTLSYHDLLQRLIRGAHVSLAEVRNADDRQNMLGWAQLGLLLGVGVVFIVWFRSAYVNLRLMGITRLPRRTYWAVLAWVIPFVNLVLPKRIANDIWRGSDPELPPETSLPSTAIPWFHTAWWGLLIANGLFARYAFQHWRDAQTLDSLSSATLLTVAGYALDLLTLLFAITVVHLSAKRQRERTSRLAGLQETAPAAAITA